MSWRYRPNPRVRAEAQRAAEEGVQRGLEALLAASRADVPVDSGTLRASGRVVITGPLRGSVVYTADYAPIVHENLNAHHSTGRAKFLETPMNSSRAEILAAIAGPLRSVF